MCIVSATEILIWVNSLVSSCNALHTHYLSLPVVCCIKLTVEQQTVIFRKAVDTSVFSETVASPSATWQMIRSVGGINILNMVDIEPRDYSNTIQDGSDLEALKMK